MTEVEDTALARSVLRGGLEKLETGSRSRKVLGKYDAAVLLGWIREMEKALREIADNEWYGEEGGGFCHPEGCDSPCIARRVLSETEDGI